jgi:hypothetical protein
MRSEFQSVSRYAVSVLRCRTPVVVVAAVQPGFLVPDVVRNVPCMWLVYGSVRRCGSASLLARVFMCHARRGVLPTSVARMLLRVSTFTCFKFPTYSLHPCTNHSLSYRSRPIRCLHVCVRVSSSSCLCVGTFRAGLDYAMFVESAAMSISCTPAAALFITSSEPSSRVVIGVVISVSSTSLRLYRASVDVCFTSTARC